MNDMTLDEIKAVLERANDDVDRVSPLTYREALNAAYKLLKDAYTSVETIKYEDNEWCNLIIEGRDI
jgi:hypothetical protein